MRDAHRMKEKLDLSLDNRQVVSLLMGGLVVLGAVFVLGVVVGKKLATSETAQDAPDLLSALDRSAESFQEARKDPPLTFQDELTKKAPPVVAAAPEPEPAPVKEPAPEPEPPPAEPEQAPAKVAAAPAPPVPEEGRVEDTPVTTRTAGDDGGLKEAFARAARPAEAKPPSQAQAGGAYTLQLSASQSRAEADSFAARLREKGYAPYVIEAEVPGRGTWFRVRMGSFSTREAASRYMEDFQRETRMEAFVASN